MLNLSFFAFFCNVQYAQETQHEKILRGLSLGIALVSCMLCCVHNSSEMRLFHLEMGQAEYDCQLWSPCNTL